MNAIIAWLDRASLFWSQIVFHSLWQSALVGLAVLALLWWGRRWPAPIRYGLLLLALAKFAMPPIWPVSTGVFGIAGLTIRGIPFSRTEAPSGISETFAGGAAAMLPRADSIMSREPFSTSTPLKSPTVPQINRPASLSLTWHGWLMVIHLLGTGAILTWIMGQMFRLRRLANQGQEVRNERLRQIWLALAARLGLKRFPRLLVVPAACSPMAWGVLRPTILLPSVVEKRLATSEIEAILAHELAHIRRGDLWLNWVQVLLWSVWWFNPVLWLVNRSLRRVREDCCDDLLLARGITSSNDYCAVLVRAARELITHRPVAAALGCAEKLHPLGYRVIRLMDGSIPRWARLSTAGLVGAVVMGLLVLPGLRSQQTSTANTDKPGHRPSSSRPSQPPPQAVAGDANLDEDRSNGRPDNGMHVFLTNSPPGVAQEIHFYQHTLPATSLPGKGQAQPEVTAPPGGGIATTTTPPKLAAQSTSRNELFAEIKWFSDRVAVDWPPLLESKRIVQQMGPQAVPILVAKLKRPEAEIGDSVNERRKAAWALGQLGPAAQSAVPALAQALQDQGDRDPMPDGHFMIRERVCTIAAMALGNIGPAARAAIPALEESLHYGVGAALPALARIAPDAPRTLTILTDALQDYSQGAKSGETTYRYEALHGLALLAEQQVGAIASIAIALKDPELGQEAVRVVLANKKFSTTAAAAMDQACKEGSLIERSDVAAALTLAGRRSPDALAVMLERLQQDDPGVSDDFIRALGWYGEQAKPAIPALLKILDRTKNPVLLPTLIGTLAGIGKGNVEVVSALEPYLLETPQEVSSMSVSFLRCTTLSALSQVGVDPKKGIPMLLKALDDPSPQIRSTAAMALADYGAAARGTVPRIIALLDDQGQGVAAMAAVALGNLGSNALGAIPALTKALDPPRDGLCNNAANALGKFGPAARSAIPALEKLLQHSTGMVKHNAAFSLWQIDGRADIVPLLVDQLKSQEAGTAEEWLRSKPSRLFTLEQLGQIGPSATPALPLLQQMLQDADPDLRARVRETLDKITRPGKSH